MKPAMAVVMSKLDASAVIMIAPGKPNCRNRQSSAGLAAVLNKAKIDSSCCHSQSHLTITDALATHACQRLIHASRARTI